MHTNTHRQPIAYIYQRKKKLNDAEFVFVEHEFELMSLDHIKYIYEGEFRMIVFNENVPGR